MPRRNQLCVPLQDLPPEGLHWRGQIPFASLDMGEDERLAFIGELFFDLHVSPVQTKILVQGRLEGQLRGHCDRCLSIYETTVSTSDVCHVFEGVKDPWIDLTEDIREDILVALPNRSLCRDDCKGLCAACGGNRNTDGCTCEDAKQASGPWAVLDTLQLPQQEE